MTRSVTKSLLDIMREKAGDSLLERTMNHSTFGKMLKSDTVMVGFEAEWKSNTLSPEWARMGYKSPGDMSLEDAKSMDSWKDWIFDEVKEDWLNDEFDAIRSRSGEVIIRRVVRAILEEHIDAVVDGSSPMTIADLTGVFGMTVDEARIAAARYLNQTDEYGNPSVGFDDSRLVDWIADVALDDASATIESELGDEWAKREREVILARYPELLDGESMWSYDWDRVLNAMGIPTEDEPNEENMAELARSFTEETGIDIKDFASNYGGTSKQNDGYTGYYLEVDSGSAELISPPQTVSKTLDDLEHVLEFIRVDGETTKKDGLHINMSVKGKSAGEYDPLKILMFLGEDHVLRVFDRDRNFNASPHMREFLTNSGVSAFIGMHREKGAAAMARAVLEMPTGADEVNVIVGFLYEQMAESRYHSFNLQHLIKSVSIDNLVTGKGTINRREDPRVEFRVMGNENYESRYSEIREGILRFAYVLDLATNRDAEREEYAKKLYRFFEKLIQVFDEADAALDDYNAGSGASKARGSKFQKEKAERFVKMLDDDFMSGSGPKFSLGREGMDPRTAGAFMSRLFANDIPAWASSKKRELWLMVAIMLKGTEIEKPNIGISKYVPYLRPILAKTGLGTKNTFTAMADGWLAQGIDGAMLYIGGESMTRQQFRDWVVERAAAHRLIH